MAQPVQRDDAFQDFLLDMDFDELIPVDNFFDTYVGALPSAPGGPQYPQNEAVQDIARIYAQPSSHIPQTVPIPTLPDPNGWHNVPPAPVDSAMPLAMDATVHHPEARDAHSYAPIQQQVLPEEPQQSQGHVQPRFSLRQPPGHQNHHPETSASGDEHGSGGVSERKTTRRQTKTERQQMLNKAAQQRYRERKKVKAMELKQAVACLQDKVEELTVVQGEKDKLAERVKALEQELALKEAQLAAANNSKQGAESAWATEGGGAPGAAAGSNGWNSGGSHAAELNGAAVGDSAAKAPIEEFEKQFVGNYTKAKEWMERKGYLNQDPLRLSDLPPEDAAQIRNDAELCFATCRTILSMRSDIDVAALITSSLDKSKSYFQGGADMWLALARKLQLSPEVQARALSLRGKYLERLDELFNERQNLNLLAVKIFLPQNAGGLAHANVSPSVNPPPFLDRCKHTFDTASVLRLLRDNLAAEQRALAELDYLVYMKLLDPLQLVFCVIAAFPEHCDVVSLLNAVAAVAEGK